MRHANRGRKLNMKSQHRHSMLRNMTTSLLIHEQISTTLPKAKELKRFVDRVITLGKRDDCTPPSGGGVTEGRRRAEEAVRPARRSPGSRRRLCPRAQGRLLRRQSVMAVVGWSNKSTAAGAPPTRPRRPLRKRRSQIGRGLIVAAKR